MSSLRGILYEVFFKVIGMDLIINIFSLFPTILQLSFSAALDYLLTALREGIV